MMDRPKLDLRKPVTFARENRHVCVMDSGHRLTNFACLGAEVVVFRPNLQLNHP
jgi:hypothetical protein